MGFRLFSEELRDECMRRQSIDAKFQEKLKGLTFRLILVGIEAPGGQDRALSINLQAGSFINVGVDIHTSPSFELRSPHFDRTKFDAKIIGDYIMIYDLATGKMDLATAMEKVEIHGDLTKLMRQAAGFTALLEFLATMDIEP